MKPLPEKTEEILFNRYFLQGFRLGEITTYAPSSTEEAKNGYDSKFLGISAFREIYLQFKAPTFSESKKRFTIRTTDHQHKMLKRYPPRTAYYVAHTFSSFEECTLAQKDIRMAVDFLKHFIAIEISALPTDVNFFHYYKPSSHRESANIKYKCESDGTTKTARHDIVGSGWLRGNRLVEQFKQEDIGVLVSLDTKDSELPYQNRGALFTEEGPFVKSQNVWSLSSSDVHHLHSGRTDNDFGLQIRKLMPL